MVIKLNINTVLGILGGLGVFAPDVTFIASFLSHQHISWLIYPAKILGFLAAFFAAAPLAVPKLRAFLALLKLATPAGEVAPQPTAKEPKRDLEATPPAVVLARPNDKGFFSLYSLVWMFILACFLLATVAWIILSPKIANAEENPKTSSIVTAGEKSSSVQAKNETAASGSTATTEVPPVSSSSYDSKYGGCRGNWCLAPAVAIKVLQYAPATGDSEEGVGLAGGYGVVWHTIVDLGLAFYGGFQKSSDKPFTAQILSMFNIANYVSIGPGIQALGQSSGPAKYRLIIGLAANWIPGLTGSK